MWCLRFGRDGACPADFAGRAALRNSARHPSRPKDQRTTLKHGKRLTCGGTKPPSRAELHLATEGFARVELEGLYGAGLLEVSFCLG